MTAIVINGFDYLRCY